MSLWNIPGSQDALYTSVPPIKTCCFDFQVTNSVVFSPCRTRYGPYLQFWLRFSDFEEPFLDPFLFPFLAFSPFYIYHPNCLQESRGPHWKVLLYAHLVCTLNISNWDTCNISRLTNLVKSFTRWLIKWTFNLFHTPFQFQLPNTLVTFSKFLMLSPRSLKPAQLHHGLHTLLNHV